MTLVVEDGTGIAGADSYASLAGAAAYWAARPQDANAARWTAATDPNREGALREATAYLDATWGALFPGSRKTAAQGRLWPRVERTALDPDDYDTIADLLAAQAETDRPLVGADGLQLAALPAPIVGATIELAARALVARLAPDVDAQGWVKRQKVGPIETEYGAPGPIDGAYGAVDRLLRPVLIGMRNLSWAWA
jgi:hypothetical protein